MVRSFVQDIYHTYRSVGKHPFRGSRKKRKGKERKQGKKSSIFDRIVPFRLFRILFLSYPRTGSPVSPTFSLNLNYREKLCVAAICSCCFLPAVSPFSQSARNSRRQAKFSMWMRNSYHSTQTWWYST